VKKTIYAGQQINVRYRKLGIYIILAMVLALAVNWFGVTLMIGPKNRKIEQWKGKAKVSNVEIETADGIKIRGWWVAGNEAVSVVLFHGIQGNRSDMRERIDHFSGKGYSVAVFDFRGHGESDKSSISFGLNESNDVDCAVEWVRKQRPGDRIFLLGQSMGAASIAMSNVMGKVDAIIFEQMYYDLDSAIKNRITARLGEWSGFSSFLFSWQAEFRFGRMGSQINTHSKLAEIETPKIFIGGKSDVSARPWEIEACYKKAREPKTIIMFEGVGHVDMAKKLGQAYFKEIDQIIK